MNIEIRKARRRDLPLVTRLLACMGDEAPMPLARAASIHRQMSRYPSYTCYLAFVDGEVPLPPYPAWSQTDTALASIAVLLRGLHDASRGFDAFLRTRSTVPSHLP